MGYRVFKFMQRALKMVVFKNNSSLKNSQA